MLEQEINCSNFSKKEKERKKKKERKILPWLGGKITRTLNLSASI